MRAAMLRVLWFWRFAPRARMDRPTAPRPWR